MKNRLPYFILLLSVLFFCTSCPEIDSEPAPKQETILPPACGFQPTALIIDPIIQPNLSWTWVTIGEMIFKYYGLPNVNPAENYACGILDVLDYLMNGADAACQVNCGICNLPADKTSMLAYMITEYPEYACQVKEKHKRTLSVKTTKASLTPIQIVAELDHKRPIVASIFPKDISSLISKPVALIVGYQYENGKLILKVNDPFPMKKYRFPNPYLAAGGKAGRYNGTYLISYTDFTEKLKWTSTWYNIGWQETQ